MPAPGNARRTFTPFGFRRPETLSSVLWVRLLTPTIPASRPAGAFQTPRDASIRAITPATAPLAGRLSVRVVAPARASTAWRRG